MINKKVPYRITPGVPDNDVDVTFKIKLHPSQLEDFEKVADAYGWTIEQLVHSLVVNSIDDHIGDDDFNYTTRRRKKIKW